MADRKRPRHSSGEPTPPGGVPVSRNVPGPRDRSSGSNASAGEPAAAIGRPTGSNASTGPATPAAGTPAATGTPTTPGTTHRRSWKHIYGTRIRTSTAILAVAFVALTVLYAYTSQRYGVVSAPPPQPRTTQSTPTVESTSSSPSSTVESSAPSVSATTGEDGVPGGRGEQGGTGTQDTTTRTVPGLPGVTVPTFGRTPESTPNPQPQFERRQNGTDTPTTSPAR
ncbi:hypothetical protein GCM10009624_12140 [Gordonia sinesedis]